ncbi:MAG: hypothetical protein K2Q12_03180 [Rickettsiales bacterium]|nr:hypothetical protein [Rickettsiales bacterium]
MTPERDINFDPNAPTESTNAPKGEGLFSKVELPKGFADAYKRTRENFRHDGVKWTEQAARGVGAAAGGALAVNGIADIVSPDKEGNRHVFTGLMKTGVGAVVAAGSLALQVKGHGALAGRG